jgi:hypothetical protein
MVSEGRLPFFLLKTLDPPRRLLLNSAGTESVIRAERHTLTWMVTLEDIIFGLGYRCSFERKCSRVFCIEIPEIVWVLGCI